MAELMKQSSFRVNAHERRVDDECKQLLIDIRRIGSEGEPYVYFGELFDDEEVEQYYEALVGTLKSAKKRGLISYKGQMLLKGMHDKVVISILDASGAPPPNVPAPTPDPPKQPRSFTFSPYAYSKKKAAPSATKWSERKTQSARNSRKTPKSPIKLKKKKEILGTLSDSEGWEEDRNDHPVGKPNNKNIVTSSDTEADWTVRKSPRRSRTLAPWRLRKTQSTANLLPTRRPLAVKRWSEQRLDAAKLAEAAKVVAPEPPTLAKPPSVNTSKENSSPVPKSSFISPPRRSKPVKNSAGEAAERMNDEVSQLMVDIRRIGDGPSVSFGALFDDDVVQNTYEALVGTLRSAKKRGWIDYKGQMLLKGMHDKVVISILKQDEKEEENDDDSSL